MSLLESIVEDLKALAPAKLEKAASFVTRLKQVNDEQRQAILTRTAGSLSADAADESERIIEGRLRTHRSDRTLSK